MRTVDSPSFRWRVRAGTWRAQRLPHPGFAKPLRTVVVLPVSRDVGACTPVYMQRERGRTSTRRWCVSRCRRWGPLEDVHGLEGLIREDRRHAVLDGEMGPLRRMAVLEIVVANRVAPSDQNHEQKHDRGCGAAILHDRAVRTRFAPRLTSLRLTEIRTDIGVSSRLYQQEHVVGGP